MRLIKSTLKNTFAGFTSAALASSQTQLDAAVATVAGTNKLPINAGTVAFPGAFFAGDTDTGLYQATANTVSLAVGGVNVLTASSGSLGVTGSVLASGGVAGAAIAATGAYSGGTGQLVTIGSVTMWLADTLPAEGGYCWANGGTLSRTAYPVLWALWGTKYGAGDGSTTFNVPNLCEVVPVGQRAMGGASSRTLLATGVLGGAPIGASTATLLATNLPSYTPSGTVSVTNGAISINGQSQLIVSGSGAGVGGGGSFGVSGAPLSASQATSTASFTGSNNGGTSAPFAVVQPSVAVNYIVRAG
ncbi:hypothetical protein UB31_00485 [Bradyrhizobium sp. LTSP849]|nr:hypothetical protein UB31_00485 [Bradyrhizobium sp. LTSP849]